MRIAFGPEPVRHVRPRKRRTRRRRVAKRRSYNIAKQLLSRLNDNSSAHTLNTNARTESTTCLKLIKYIVKKKKKMNYEELSRPKY